MIQPIQINEGDYGYSLGPWTLQDGNGNAQDLTNATLVLNVQDSQDPSGALLFSGAVTVDTANLGLAHYLVQNGNFPQPGTFIAQIVATYSGEKISWPAFQIIVLPNLPRSNN
jgi:hypothetical protein